MMNHMPIPENIDTMCQTMIPISSKIKENNPNIKLGEALEPLLKDQRVLVTVKGPNPVQITVAQLAQKIKDNYFHGVDIALDAAEVDAKKQEILDDTLFRIAGTFEAQKLGLDQTPRYRMEVAEFERRILFDVFMAKVITPDIRYGEEEIQNYYDKHQADYMTPAMFKFKSLPFYRQADAEKAVQLGLDGIIVSNHGGRQLDAGESTIKPLTRIAKSYGEKITVMMDSGLRSGPDIARTLASGAKFTFMGRSFMYGVAALGNQGGNHTISLLKTELQQVMEQICCEDVSNFPHHKID